jgi:hypothetical protein
VIHAIEGLGLLTASSACGGAGSRPLALVIVSARSVRAIGRRAALLDEQWQPRRTRLSAERGENRTEIGTE